MKLSGGDASNYTLLGEAHEFTFELRAKFKALKNIENKINELAKSGKKIITGATQAVPKVVVMTTTPTAAPAAGGSPSSGAPAAQEVVFPAEAPEEVMEDQEILPLKNRTEFQL